MSSSETPPPPPREPPWPLEPSGVWGSYDVHCHCGAVRLTMNMSPPLYEEESQGKGIWTVNECNCSWCERNGAQTIHPLSENVKFTRGEDNITKYSFGNKNAEHMMCKTCGCFVGSKGDEMFIKAGVPVRMVVNARMLKDYDPKKLTIVTREYMKHMPPKYSIDD